MSKLLKALALAGAMISCASTAAAQTPGAFVDVPGGKLWYETCGSGPQAVVLIHDGVLHSAGWDDVWPELCKTFHVVRYDRRGYGRSPEAQSPYSPIDDVQAVMGAARFTHAVVIGASNGGGIAVEFTLAHPGEVDRLILVGPDVSGVPRSKYYIERVSEFQRRMAAGDFAGAISSSWAFPPGDEKDDARALKLEMASPQDISHKDPALPRPPAAPRLHEIKAPTLVLVGEFDQADNQAQAGMVAYAIPGAIREIIPNAGHLIYMAQPAAFADTVTRFAKGQASSGTEAALRRAIDGFKAGAPDYALFSPGLAQAVRANLEQIKASQAALGPLRALAFKRTTTDGADIYVATYEKGSGEVRIVLGSDGRIYDLRPAPLD